MHKFLFGLTLLSLIGGSAAPVADSMTGVGLQLGFVTFHDGGSVTVLYQEQGGASWLVFVYTDGQGMMREDRASLPVVALPDQVIVNVCGTHVQASANWTEGYNPSTAPVYRYSWELPADSGICTVNQMYFPFIQQP